ncbi:hypothetical protein K504DRAFT_463445 [Pleomassaria siparia CBS 279.74]|uniref:Zn(2)-C6 fungal-type domain-containing protein n=1 Tax=Pleomassaria siparia CBS 279.74 TaxID=1314801 RepID=A0A6G1JRX9_9PLEO|nr:hypothetical protein K504DRAFT_463445 [Pleomassaria siparia CBS 279.74]
MNFVDVQPQSFLDYAWTTPNQAPMGISKSSKTSRKQNRCCDQCRKGKRACDAAILEDTLLDTNGSSEYPPTVFHYSDVFGPLTPCANCEKTKKRCTFEWLRSQRIAQAAPQTSNSPPSKRQRTRSGSSNDRHSRIEVAHQVQAAEAPHSTTASETSTTGGDFVAYGETEPFDLGITFADFPTGMPLSSSSESDFFPFDEGLLGFVGVGCEGQQGLSCVDLLEVGDVYSHDLNSHEEELSEGAREGAMRLNPCPQDPATIGNQKSPSEFDKMAMQKSRKRRRRSSSRSSSIAGAQIQIQTPTLSPTDTLLSSTNNALLAENLLKIYHNSFEKALSCWVTERTCPYSIGSEVSLANDAGPDWNRIYHRVFRLDRLAAPIRGRHLTCSENQAASKAINLAIFAFSTQWAQSSQRSKDKYPFHVTGSDNDLSQDAGVSSPCKDFDSDLQISAWHEARAALKNVAEVESFRVVLAQIVFSVTQKPMVKPENSTSDVQPPYTDKGGFSGIEEPQLDEQDVTECEDLLSRLKITMDGDGPPTHLEQGLRLIHSLRSRASMSETLNKKPAQRVKRLRLSPNRLDATDRATIDLLFWLGVMFDTLSSAMHKRPLVVSDEDSDIYPTRPTAIENSTNGATVTTDGSYGATTQSGGIWDDHLLARQRKQWQGIATRWPCSSDQAESLLCNAAPVKVLLFRKVTRIQTLLVRNVPVKRIDNALRSALNVCNHWEEMYAPFIGDCIEDHNCLPPQVQSWYLCLAAHWHLATLLLADLIETIDNSELSAESRMPYGFVERFRIRNASTLSDLARCACPPKEALFSRSRVLHFGLNEGALLTEPWTAVLIRAFAMAGAVLFQCISSIGKTHNEEDAFRRVNDCVQALWYLGRKSDMALSAAKILTEALEQRQRGAREKSKGISPCAEGGLLGSPPIRCAGWRTTTV